MIFHEPLLDRIRVETLDNGDVILYWPNGDKAVRFQADGPFFACAYPGAHPLDGVSMQLAPDMIEALRDWCEQALQPNQPESQGGIPDDRR